MGAKSFGILIVWELFGPKFHLDHMVSMVPYQPVYFF